ncbi:hypothetical protein ACJX0J_042254, partial [Zea mays]
RRQLPEPPTPRDASRPSAPRVARAGGRDEAVGSVERTALPGRRSLLYTHRAQMPFRADTRHCSATDYSKPILDWLENSSDELTVLDTQLPVKQAFKIMHDEGLALVPLWDDRQGTITGMLTASDFVLILRK